jgi:FtsP/CotA-like multicopper oxidase with cupredoxin domain
MSRSGSPARVDRRTFLAGAAGGLVAVSLARCGGTSSPAQTTEAVGGWLQPISRRSAGGQLSTTLRASQGPVLVGTKRAQAIAYEQMYPGPTLEVRAGEVLRVDLVNDTGQPTNLHTHGLHVSPDAPSDDVLFAIRQGHSYQYEYRLPADHPAGTYWYHAHDHPLTDSQVGLGLFGTLIIRGKEDAASRVAPSGERVMVFSQVEIAKGAIVPAPISSLSVQSTVVNGQYQPSLRIAPGEIQRWRMVNASVVFLRLKLDGHVMHKMAVDGNTMAAVVPEDVVEIAPGGRVDVLVQLDREGTFNLRSLSFDSFGVFNTSMVPVPQPVVRVVSQGSPVSPRPKLPTTLVPFDDLRHAKIDYRRTIRLAELEPRGIKSPSPNPYYKNEFYRYYVDGRIFNLHRVDQTMVLGDTEEWHFINETYEPHPIHIHQNPVQVVAVNDKPVDERHYRDTATLPPFGTLTLRMRFLDYAGKFVWHCHILFHEDHGMMQLLEVVKNGRPQTVAALPAGTELAAAAQNPLECHLPLV